MRPELTQVLSEVVSARINLESLRRMVLLEMQRGDVPFTLPEFRALEGVSYALEAAFNLMKGLQWPTTLESRSEDATGFLAALDSVVEHVLQNPA